MYLQIYIFTHLHIYTFTCPCHIYCRGVGGDRESAAGSDYSLFEALRETIYSEVATLISQNENRPHFLIELFRELQMLSSDYLRQRGLYSIQVRVVCA